MGVTVASRVKVSDLKHSCSLDIEEFQSMPKNLTRVTILFQEKRSSMINMDMYTHNQKLLGKHVELSCLTCDQFSCSQFPLNKIALRHSTRCSMMKTNEFLSWLER